jgi:hypothetical protein
MEPTNIKIKSTDGFLTFIGPCVVIYSDSTIIKKHLLFQIIYSCKTLYMFRTVFTSIIRSSNLRIQHQVYVKLLLLPAAAGSSSSLTHTCCCIRSFKLLMMDGKTVRNL